HRDLKTTNVFIDDAGRPHIGDFSLTIHRDEQDHATCGTLAYMSPEQFYGKHLDARADVWAIGVIMYELLTGILPFDGEGIVENLLSEEPVPPRQLKDTIPGELEQICLKCLA